MILALTCLTLIMVLEFVYILSLRQTMHEAVERVRSAYEGNQALLKVIAEYRKKEAEHDAEGQDLAGDQVLG